MKTSLFPDRLLIMNDKQRWVMFFLIAMGIMMLHTMMTQKQREAQQEKQTGQTAPRPTPSSVPENLAGDHTGAAPLPDTQGAPEAPAPEPVPEEKGEEVVVETDSQRVRFTTAGAYPVAWEIVDERFARAAQADVEAAEAKGVKGMQVGDFLPVQIIPDYTGLEERRDYPLMVVLKESDGKFFHSFNQRVYDLERRTEADGTKVLRFTSPATREGVRLVKTYRFPPEGFLVDIDISLESLGSAASQKLAFNEPTRPGLGLAWGPGIGNTHFTDRWDGRFYKVAAYVGEEIKSDDLGDWEDAAQGESVTEEFRGAVHWAALDSRFYLAAIAPRSAASPMVRGVAKRQHVPASKQARKDLTPPLSVEVYSGGFLLEPGETKTFAYSLYVGPKKGQILDAVDEKLGLGLAKIMFHSNMWLIRFLATFMLHLLTWFHTLTGNYGVAIILLVLVMRLITQPFTHIGMKSQARVMAEQKRVKPLIDAINEKYKDDPERRNREIWKTYREHGVNPFGMLKGCLWMLVQLPIFFSLYWLLVGAIDLRGASFLWIDDLTAPDALFTLPFSLPLLGNKFNLIPILMGVSQVFAQRLQSSNIEDPTQRQMATIMPIVFVAIFYRFAAGLSLYWFVSNLWQIAFQIFVNKRVREEAEAKAGKAFEERKREQVVAPAPESRAKGRKSAKKGWREKLLERIEEAQKQRNKRGK